MPLTQLPLPLDLETLVGNVDEYNLAKATMQIFVDLYGSGGLRLKWKSTMATKRVHLFWWEEYCKARVYLCKPAALCLYLVARPI